MRCAFRHNTGPPYHQRSMTNNCLIIQNWFVDEPLSSRLRESLPHVTRSCHPRLASLHTSVGLYHRGHDGRLFGTLRPFPDFANNIKNSDALQERRHRRQRAGPAPGQPHGPGAWVRGPAVCAAWSLRRAQGRQERPGAPGVPQGTRQAHRGIGAAPRPHRP